MDYQNFLSKKYNDLLNDETFVQLTNLPVTPFEKEFFLEDFEKGISMIYDENYTLLNIRFYSEGHEGYQEFTNDLPFNLSFSDTRKKVIEKLGNPDESRDSKKVPILGIVPAVDKFIIGNESIIIQYNNDKILDITMSNKI